MIGVFDSGVGGLSVLKALRRAMPEKKFIYLGDTARLPYGTKGADTVIRYAEKAAAVLLAKEIQCLVVACNTVSAVALPHLQALNPQVPVIGVIEAGAKEAIRATTKQAVAVIATEGTVARHAYQEAILKKSPDKVVHELACPLMVAMTEAGWTEGPLVEAIIEAHLQPLLSHFRDNILDTLVLGCTHFPALKTAITNVVGKHITLIDSGESVAKAVVAAFLSHAIPEVPNEPGVEFLVTDDKIRFTRIASIFLGAPVEASDVHLIDVH